MTMPWQPAQGTQPLSPFGHQVAGQSSMLRYDKTTVCKPLIAREHFVYKSLPPDLAEFTPEYRGEIEVQLMEEDGYIQLYGLCVDNEAHDDDGVWTCPAENHGHEPASVKPKVATQDSVNRSTVRLLRSGSYEVCASTNQVFYTADSKPDQPHTQSLNPWSLKNHKRLLDKMRKSEHSHDKIRFILLKNVVADFRHPCILDLKIGSRLHGDNASSMKVASQSEKCRRTTSSTLGVRLCGMQVYQVDANAYHSVDKYHGRTLNELSFRRMLYNFLHNGTRFRSELIQPIVSRLSELITCLEGLHSFRFYASSLLIIYDGDVGVTGGNQEVKVQEAKPAFAGVSAPADNITDHVLSSQELIQNKQLSDNVFSSPELVSWGSNIQDGNHYSSEKVCQGDVVQSSKELCPLTSPQSAVEHPVSSRECFESAKTQAVDTSWDSSSVDLLGNFPKPLVSPRKQLNSVSDLFECGVLLAELPAQDVSSTESLGDHPSSTNVIHQHSDTPNLPFSSSSSLKTDSIKQMPNTDRSLPDPENSKTGDALLLQNNHRIDQVPNLLDEETLSVCHRVSPQDVVSSEQQTLSSDTNRQTVKTVNAAEVALPSVILSTETHVPAACHTQSASIKAVEKLPLVTEYGVAKNHLKQIPHVSVGDLAFNDKPMPEVDQLKEYVSVSAAASISTLANVTSHVKQMTCEGGSVSSHTLELSQPAGNSVKVDVKMIDFAHTTHQGFTMDQIKHTGPDTDYIFGLKNLLNLFQELLGSE
ncbi:unnamed protein product [Candidula unifasciata]|uniref:Kinase n=1 Tax=Candidula unifasciata TaxID=100452 RepID=A0A8S4A7Z0_9EUPU|nr:unnamed protein product [Candidula unifasciata]